MDDYDLRSIDAISAEDDQTMYLRATQKVLSDHIKSGIQSVSENHDWINDPIARRTAAQRDVNNLTALQRRLGFASDQD